MAGVSLSGGLMFLDSLVIIGDFRAMGPTHEDVELRRSLVISTVATVHTGGGIGYRSVDRGHF